MKYFLHDSNAFNDEKITELYINFGYEGIGLFFTILEKLANQEKPIKTEVLKSQLRVGKKLARCWDFMEKIGILSSNNGETFNKQLLNFSEKYKKNKIKNQKRVSDFRSNNQKTKSVTHYNQECTPPKGKVSKGKVLNKYAAEAADSSKKKSEDDFPMDVNQFYKWTQKSPHRHIKIIGEYADTIKPTFSTKGQWTVFLKRNLRPAKDLAPFTDDQIEKSVIEIKKSKDWLNKYTLETIIKFLN